MSGPPPPQRVPADVDECRALTTQVIEETESTIERAASFSEGERQQRVNDEWSAVESIRHLVLVADLWLSKTIKGEADPFHPIALPPHFAPAKAVSPTIDPDARPTFDEAVDVLRGRLTTLREHADAITADALAQPVANHAKTVAGAFGVLFDEFMAHNYFMNRDLDAIEKGRS